VRYLKTPSAMVERQMLPRQTKRTETFLGESVVDMLALRKGWIFADVFVGVAMLLGEFFWDCWWLRC
jgi:glutathionyl-hydroquinone reductase